MTRQLNSNVILGDLPSDWKIADTRYPQATPGSLFVDRVVAEGLGAPPRRSQHREFLLAENPRRWQALESWCTESDKFPVDTPGCYRLSTGTRIWRRHAATSKLKKLP